MYLRTFVFTLVIGLMSVVFVDDLHAQKTLLNVSYDPTRELYQDFNAVFARYWKAKSSETPNIRQSQPRSKVRSSDQRAAFDRTADDSAAIISQQVVSAFKYIDLPAVKIANLLV